MHTAQKVRIILIAPAIVAIFILSGCFKKDKSVTKKQKTEQVRKEKK